MASVTCGLTAKERDQLRNRTLVSRMGLGLPFYAEFRLRSRTRERDTTNPSVVMVTMVYQNAAGMLLNLVPGTFFSA